jgi:hypothetical protein
MMKVATVIPPYINAALPNAALVDVPLFII